MYDIGKQKQEIKETILTLIKAGNTFGIKTLEKIYSNELQIVKIDEKGSVYTYNKQVIIKFFSAKKVNKDAPLEQTADFNYIAVSKNNAHVLVTRIMQLTDRFEKSVYSIRLIKNRGAWKVNSETVFVQPVENTLSPQ